MCPQDVGPGVFGVFLVGKIVIARQVNDIIDATMIPHPKDDILQLFPVGNIHLNPAKIGIRLYP